MQSVRCFLCAKVTEISTRN
ncbi:hypothetical protein LINGRAPRIM_LOCUS1635 [Linum grandiflorum]